MTNEYSRGYAAGLREFDHGHSFASVEQLRAERDSLQMAEGRLREALSAIEDEMVDDTSPRAQRINRIISEALSPSGDVIRSSMEFKRRNWPSPISEQKEDTEQ